MTIANADRRRVHRLETFATDDKLSTARTFAALASDLAAAPDLNRVLATVLECAVAAVSCDWAAIRLHPSRRSATTSAVSDPSFTAAADLPRGPQWSADLLGLGVRSSYVVDLAVSRSVIGTIGYFATRSNSFDGDDKASADLLAVHASLAIAASRSATSLTEAVDSRAIVGQAVGIVMERFKTDSETAFALLRRCSQDNNMKLRDVAETLITTRLLVTESPTA